jgi:hypothetical protein
VSPGTRSRPVRSCQAEVHAPEMIARPPLELEPAGTGRSRAAQARQTPTATRSLALGRSDQHCAPDTHHDPAALLSTPATPAIRILEKPADRQHPHAQHHDQPHHQRKARRTRHSKISGGSGLRHGPIRVNIPGQRHPAPYSVSLPCKAALKPSLRSGRCLPAPPTRTAFSTPGSPSGM